MNFVDWVKVRTLSTEARMEALSSRCSVTAVLTELHFLHSLEP